MIPREIRTMTLFGLMTAIILVVVSFYAVEDLPKFGDENSAVNKYIKLFSVNDSAGLVDNLKAGVLPEEILNKIEKMGFIHGPTCVGCQNENYPTIEGNYTIKRIEKGTWEGGRIDEGGWNVLIREGELFYNDPKDPQEWYFIKDPVDGKLNVYRYNWPTRVIERTVNETAMINSVTSGLADYRGYDTMGEETVILTGAIGVILLVRRRGRL